MSTKQTVARAKCKVCKTIVESSGGNFQACKCFEEAHQNSYAVGQKLKEYLVQNKAPDNFQLDTIIHLAGCAYHEIHSDGFAIDHTNDYTRIVGNDSNIEWIEEPKT